MSGRKNKGDTKVKPAAVLNVDGIFCEWEIIGKPDDWHCAWGNKDDRREMQQFRVKGYQPVRWKDGISCALADKPTNENDPICIGDRILMWCPKEIAIARRLKNASRYKKKHEAAEGKIREVTRKLNGASVTRISETTKGPPPASMAG